MKSKLLVPTLILTVVTVSMNSNNARAEEGVVLTPSRPEFFGLRYEQALEILTKYRTVTYGQPIQVQASTETHGIELSAFNDFVVTVDAQELLAQPNRDWRF